MWTTMILQTVTACQSKMFFFFVFHSVPLILGAENMAVVVSTLTFFSH